MSTLKADTIQSTGGGAVTLTKQSAAKAWVNFKNSVDPPAIQGSFNVSSLTDDGAEIKFNLISAMADAFYAPVGSGGGATLGNPANRNLAMNALSTTSVDTELYTTSNAQTTGHCHGSISGDLA